jgi:hypothetical protein
MPVYYVVYERPNSICTWRGDADDPDQFILGLLARCKDILKFTEMQLEVDEWPVKPNQQLSVEKYNHWLRRLRRHVRHH